MKRSALALALAVITFTASADDERAAAAVVKKYSKAIASQLDAAGDDRNHYKAATLVAGDKELFCLGFAHVVYRGLRAFASGDLAFTHQPEELINLEKRNAEPLETRKSVARNIPTLVARESHELAEGDARRRVVVGCAPSV